MNNSVTRREVLIAGAKYTTLAASIPVLGSLAGCGGGGSSSLVGTNNRSVVSQWMTETLNTISAVKPGPPMTARALGIVSTAMYDAWASYHPVAQTTRLGDQTRRPVAEHNALNKHKAISYAAYRVLVDIYPAQKARFDAKMASFGYDVSDTSTDLSTPAGVGNTVSSVIIAFRHADGSNQLNNYADTTGYVPINTPDLIVDPSQWQQLRFANGASPAYIAPHWGNVIPFALSSPSNFRPAAPPAYGTPTYLEQAQEVLDYITNLNDRGKVTAEYWADGPSSVLPPGHWQLFGQLVSDRDRHTMDDDAKLFFMLGNAVFDAGIACWDCKRVFNSSRPITAIRNLFAGKSVPSFEGPSEGVKMVDGSQWKPYQSPNFITPPFPEYTSGHSTFSAAAAQVLKRFTGSDEFVSNVTINPGQSGFESGIPTSPVTLSWSTFSEMADQAGLSRMYGGIHFRAGDQEGRRCGRLVGDKVFEMCMAYITGTAGSRTGN